MAPIRVGEPGVRPDATAHVKGVREGNALGSYEMEPGHHLDGTAARPASGRVTAIRSRRACPTCRRVDRRMADRTARPRTVPRRESMSSRKKLLVAAGAGLAGMMWREYPSMVRYLRIKRL